MRRAKSIDEIYEEAKGFDAVITVDASLADALNARIDSARVGGFAYTPRLIALREAAAILGEGAWSDLRIVAEISEEAGCDFRFAHSELRNIRNIRRHTRDVEKHLHSAASRRVYRSFSAMPTLEKAMEAFDADAGGFYGGKRVAVVTDGDMRLFDDLDKHFLPRPGRFEEIDAFARDDFEIDRIYMAGNDHQLAENAVDLITPENAGDSAIVMDVSGPIADAVRAALYRRGIDFKNAMAVRDLSQVRDYLRFISLSLSFRTLRIRHVREMFASYGIRLRQEEDAYLLSRRMGSLPSERAERTAELMRDIRSVTFGEACDAVVDPRHRPQVRMLLRDMGMEGEKVTSDRAGKISYAVNNVDELRHNEQIPAREKRGVLLADCRSSVYIDRGTVIFLGMGPEWIVSSPGRGYIDREAEAAANAVRFATLLQQGSSRIYMANSMRDGREPRPSPVFGYISEYLGDGRRASRFSDICSEEPVRGRWLASPSEGPPRPAGPAAGAPPSGWRFSKSSYNLYRQCPRAFMFGDFLKPPDSKATVMGGLVHDFAELCLCYPDLVREKGADSYAEEASEMFSGLSSDRMRDLDGARIRGCMRNVAKFVESLGLGRVPLDRENSARKYKNAFMEARGLERCSGMTEAAFQSSSEPLFGKFDLVFGSRVVDYKTGQPRRSESHDPSDVVKAMAMDGDGDRFEFQPLVYLHLLRDGGAAPPWRFSLFFAEDNAAEAASDDSFDPSRNVIDVFLMEEGMEELVRRSDLARGEFGKTYKAITDSWEAFADAAMSAGIDGRESWDSDDRLIASVVSRCGMSDSKTSRERAAAALRKLSKLIAPGMFEAGGAIYVPSDSLDRFLSRVRADHAKASAEIASGSPAEPSGDCDGCYFSKACTLEGGSEAEGGPDE
ncbi:MAG: PD-(D/E)XK nuclease family protein [Candidatus Methanoplasma sp.]|jgi:hypothetical protein|nr:PD-(D/E)XK nuclease family protein [Candidatus Methanoplasma sp.]